MGTLGISATIILDGCSTIAPSPAVPKQAAFDGATQSDGIIAKNKDGTWKIDAFFVRTYNRREAKYGKALGLSPLDPKTTRISSEILESSLVMAIYEHEGK
jgi:hypothetical protein